MARKSGKVFKGSAVVNGGVDLTEKSSDQLISPP